MYVYIYIHIQIYVHICVYMYVYIRKGFFSNLKYNLYYLVAGSKCIICMLLLAHYLPIEKISELLLLVTKETN